jgi:hypothetical protein
MPDASGINPDLHGPAATVQLKPLQPPTGAIRRDLAFAIAEDGNKVILPKFAVSALARE